MATGNSMNGPKASEIDELRPEYKRSDFDNLERGKYADRLTDHPEKPAKSSKRRQEENTE